MTSPFDAARELLYQRLRLRGQFAREKALEPGEFPEKWLTRAEEAEACAQIALHLSPTYAPPESPDMKRARASRKAGGG